MFECVICYDEYKKDCGLGCFVCKKKVCFNCLEKMIDIQIKEAFEEYDLTPEEFNEKLCFPKCPICRSKMFNHGFGLVLYELQELFMDIYLVEEELEEVFF